MRKQQNEEEEANAKTAQSRSVSTVNSDPLL